MIKLKIKTGDQVIVLSGKYKGKTGIIKKIYPKTHRVIINGINIITKRIKASNKSTNDKIVKKESPLHISKVALLDRKSGKSTKVGILIKDGQKTRFLKKSGEYLENVINQKKIV